MRRIAFGLLVGLALSACAQQPKYKEYSDETANVALVQSAPAADASADAPADAPAAPDGEPAPPRPAVAAGAPMLAYSYRYGLVLPASAVSTLLARHEAACASAGYRLCQVVSSNVEQRNRDTVRGELIVRATPAWLKRFRDDLAGDAKTLGGRLASSRVNSEDLSRQIVDSDAQLKAKLTLRDRLQALLASRPGKLSDLLEVERELANVQGEIDSMQSQLAVMRGRVATSEMTVAYQSTGTAEPDGGWSPLAKALRDFADIVALSLGGLVRVTAWVAPWVVILGGFLWLVRKRLPKFRWPFGRRQKPSLNEPG